MAEEDRISRHEEDCAKKWEMAFSEMKALRSDMDTRHLENTKALKKIKKTEKVAVAVAQTTRQDARDQMQKLINRVLWGIVTAVVAIIFEVLKTTVFDKIHFN